MAVTAYLNDVWERNWGGLFLYEVPTPKSAGSRRASTPASEAWAALAMRPPRSPSTPPSPDSRSRSFRRKQDRVDRNVPPQGACSEGLPRREARAGRKRVRPMHDPFNAVLDAGHAPLRQGVGNGAAIAGALGKAGKQPAQHAGGHSVHDDQPVALLAGRGVDPRLHPGGDLVIPFAAGRTGAEQAGGRVEDRSGLGRDVAIVAAANFMLGSPDVPCTFRSAASGSG